MCDPITATVAVVALAGAYSTYESGKTQAEFAEYEGKQQAADAKAEAGAAQVESDRLRKMGRKAAAEANAAIAGSGQQIGSAGSLALNREIYRGAEEDAYFALTGGKDRAARLNAQSNLTRAKGKAVKQAANASAFMQVAQAGTGAYGGWRRAGSPMPQTSFGPGTI